MTTTRLCRANPEAWFPRGFTRPYQAQIDAAKVWCMRCPALRECREEALGMADRLPVTAFTGVQAGLTPNELMREARERRRRRDERFARERAQREAQDAS